MMETYDRAVCATELRLRDAIFGKITTEGWHPTKAFEAPKSVENENTPIIGGSAQTPAILHVEDGHPGTNESVTAVCKTHASEASESDSSTSSITWDNVSVLSEVDIADLYSDL